MLTAHVESSRAEQEMLKEQIDSNRIQVFYLYIIII